MSAPDTRPTPRQWVRTNLFASRGGSVLTVVFTVLVAYTGYRLLWFAAVSSDWEIIRRNLRVFMVNVYPADELWRLWVALYILVGTAGFFSAATAANVEHMARAAGRELDPRPGLIESLRRYWPVLLALVVLLSLTRTWTPTLLTLAGAALLFVARWLGRRARWLARFTWLAALIGVVVTFLVMDGPGNADWTKWGGLLLTLYVTVAGISLSFPLGVLVALGRRSSLPALRWITVVYIELIRGVPLVALLFFGQYVIPLFFPNTVEPPPALARAMIVIVLFEAAYLAEAVRGGLQAVPRGQYEAAQALGLRPWNVMRLVAMPQALRAVIPALVGQFISLYKDTTLLAIVSFTDLLEVAKTTTSQPSFLGQGLHTVTFAFAALIFWAGSYTMSRESRRLERRLGIGERR
jgi:general L-amino acid transport system permease protein